MTGDHACVVKRYQRVHHLFAHTRIAARQAGGLEHQDQPHHTLAHGLAHAHGVRAQQLELQRGQVFARNALHGQLAKAGVHAIHGGVALGGLLDQRGARADAVAAGRVDCHLGRRGAAQFAQLRQRELAGDKCEGHPSIGRLRWLSLALCLAMS
jgi:hypothetical protein